MLVVQFQWDRITVGEAIDLLHLQEQGATPEQMRNVLFDLLERLVPGGIRRRPISVLPVLLAQLASELPAFFDRVERQTRDRADLQLGGKALAAYCAPAPAWLN